MGFEATLRQSGSARYYRHQFRSAAGILNGLGRIFSGEPSHQQRQLTIGCHPDRNPIKLLHIFREANAAAIHFHKKLDDLHDSFPAPSDWFGLILTQTTNKKAGDGARPISLTSY